MVQNNDAINTDTYIPLSVQIQREKTIAEVTYTYTRYRPTTNECSKRYVAALVNSMDCNTGIAYNLSAMHINIFIFILLSTYSVLWPHFDTCF